MTYPKKWMSEAREIVSEETKEEESFDWRRRIQSIEGWFLVGKKFGDDWAMVDCDRFHHAVFQKKVPANTR